LGIKVEGWRVIDVWWVDASSEEERVRESIVIVEREWK
jgi:hypothetical protein